MATSPLIDINLFVHNGASTVAAAIDSVLAQSWTDWRLTLIDDGSTDGTVAILQACAATDPRIALKRNRCNTGAVGAFQRGFWIGDADFVMPKSADDLIDPDFIARLMAVLLDHPRCAMAHAAGLSFSDGGTVRFRYPAAHNLHAVDADPVMRAARVMATYTSAPSFWGIYRRDAVDRLAPIAPRAGWDHVLLAELALYGEIRHVPEPLYWRRGTGRPVADLARAATAEAARGIALGDPMNDPLWWTPCLTTAYAHLENFALARLPAHHRRAVMDEAAAIFAARWGDAMRRELAAARPRILAHCHAAAGAATRGLARTHLTRLLAAAEWLLPDQDLSAEHGAVAALAGASHARMHSHA